MTHQKPNAKPVIGRNGYVSVQEVAKLLNLSRHTVYRRIKRGEIVAVELGGFKLIRGSEVERLLKQAS